MITYLSIAMLMVEVIVAALIIAMGYKQMKSTQGNKEEVCGSHFSNTDELKNTLNDYCETFCTIFENPDYIDAVIGISDDDRVIYDYDLMVQSLMKEDGMSEEEAIDFISYNTMRTIPYMENAPIIIRRF